LQHDFEGLFLFFLYFFFYLGCRRVSFSSDNVSVDLCRFVVDVISRPNNKTEAVADSVIGGTVVGTTGVASTTQIGVCCENVVIYYILRIVIKYMILLKIGMEFIIMCNY
jgi:hypothetical protein